MKAKAVWLTALLVFAPPACVRNRREPFPEARSVPRATYELLDSGRVEAAAAKVLQGVIDDIGAIKGRYPELRDWDGEEMRRRIEGVSDRFAELGGRDEKDVKRLAELWRTSGFAYAFRVAGGGHFRRRFGSYGCSLSVCFEHDAMPRQRRLYTAEEVRLWKKLNVRSRHSRRLPSIPGHVTADVHVGRRHSDGFVEEVDSIFTRHLDRLTDHDARRTAAPQDPTAPPAP